MCSVGGSDETPADRRLIAGASRAKGKMRVDGIVYADAAMMADIREDESLEQVANVAHLPGIVGASLAMPDIHWGYGFPIGGVAAMDAEDGVVSPGGVGYDINCGVRLVALGAEPRRTCTPRLRDDRARRSTRACPTGVGAHRRDLRLSRDDLAQRAAAAARAWAVERGFGSRRATSSASKRAARCAAPIPRWCRTARASAAPQLGTLGSGNHFAELQYVAEIYDEPVAARVRPRRDQVTVDDPQRLARARPPGLRRPPARHDARRRAIRHRAARPAALLRAARRPEGRAYLGGDERGRQLRLRQPPGDDALGARGVADALGITSDADAASARCTTSATTSRSSRRSRSTAAPRVVRPSQGRDARVSAGHPQTPAAYRESASRC